MKIVYPSTLPLPLKDGYGLKRKSGVKGTEMESGIRRFRQTTRNAPTDVSVTWSFTESEFAIFEGWYQYDAKEGAAEFDIPLLGSQGLTTHRARFKGEAYDVIKIREQING